MAKTPPDHVVICTCYEACEVVEKHAENYLKGKGCGCIPCLTALASICDCVQCHAMREIWGVAQNILMVFGDNSEQVKQNLINLEKAALAELAASPQGLVKKSSFKIEAVAPSEQAFKKKQPPSILDYGAITPPVGVIAYPSWFTKTGKWKVSTGQSPKLHPGYPEPLLADGTQANKTAMQACLCKSCWDTWLACGWSPADYGKAYAGWDTVPPDSPNFKGIIHPPGWVYMGEGSQGLVPEPLGTVLPGITFPGLSLLSEKAKGIQNLVKSTNPYSNTGSIANIKAAKVIHEEHLADDKFFPAKLFPVFARPCPLIACHGFVDSRVVNSLDDIKAMAEKIKATGNPIEILLQKPLDARWSAIVNPTLLSVGPGHAGATSEKSMSIPTEFNLQELTAAKLPAEALEKTPYIEIVTEEGKLPQLVQLRGGPEPQKLPDFIPYDTTITEVIVAEDQDLLEWKTLIEGKETGNGTVVYLNGKGWSSHYAAHAKTRNLPIISTFVPNVGMKLDKIDEYVPTKADWERLAYWLARTINTPQPNFSSKEWIRFAFAGVHHFPMFRSFTEGECKVIAVSLTAMIRIVFSLGMGELRHWPGRSKLTKEGFPFPEPLWKYQQVKNTAQGLESRTGLYQWADKFSFKEVAQCLPHLTWAFRQGGWATGGFGGRKWSVGTELAWRLCVKMADFMSDPRPEAWPPICDDVNMMANAVHNGGRYYNKVIDAASMEVIAHHPGGGLLTKAFHVLYEFFEPADKPVRFRMIGTLFAKLIPKVTVTKINLAIGVAGAAKAIANGMSAPSGVEWNEEEMGPKPVETIQFPGWQELAKQKLNFDGSQVKPMMKEWPPEYNKPGMYGLHVQTPAGVSAYAQLWAYKEINPNYSNFNLMFFGDAAKKAYTFWQKEVGAKTKFKYSLAGSTTPYWPVKNITIRVDKESGKPLFDVEFETNESYHTFTMTLWN